MSIIIPFVEIDIEPIIEEAKEKALTAVHFLLDVPISAAQKAVALIKETSLGTAILNLISAAHSSQASGQDKFSAVFKAATGAYEVFVGNGGLSGLIAAGLSVLRQVVQSIYDDFIAAFLPA